MRKQIQASISAIFLFSTITSTSALASLGDTTSVPDEELTRRARHRQLSSESLLPMKRFGGYIVEGKDGKLCGEGPGGADIGIPKCSPEFSRIALSTRSPQGAVAKVNQRGEEATGQTRSAGPVVVVAIGAALYCAATGAVQAEHDKMQSVIKIADLETMRDNIGAGAVGSVMAWAPAKALARAALPNAGAFARAGLTGVVIGAICGGGFLAGYAGYDKIRRVYNFWFPDQSALGPPQRK